MKKCFLLWAVMFVLLSVHVTHALVQVDVLSPTTCIRGTGEPVTETFTFPGVSGPATVKLTNGSLKNGSIEKVSSSIVTVNGQVVFGSSEFNQNVGYLEKAINLSERQNILEVLLKGKPGGQVTIQIIQDFDAEAAAVIGPEGGTVEVVNDDSPLHGMSVEFPSGSVPEGTIVTIGLIEDAELPNKNTLIGAVSSIRTTQPLQGYVQVQLPITEQVGVDEQVVIYTQDDGGGWDVIPSVFVEGSFVKYETTHFSYQYPTKVKFDPNAHELGKWRLLLFNMYKSVGYPNFVSMEANLVDMIYHTLNYQRFENATTNAARVMIGTYTKTINPFGILSVMNSAKGFAGDVTRSAYDDEELSEGYLGLLLCSLDGMVNGGAPGVIASCGNEFMLSVFDMVTRFAGVIVTNGDFKKINNINIANDYLTLYYMYGTDVDWLADQEGLLPDGLPIPEDDVIEGIAEKYKKGIFAFNDYDLDAIYDMVEKTRSWIENLAEVVDKDTDGILDDGDASGTPGDNPCIGGNTENCDDNCPNTPNPDQTDSDGDGIGDECEASQLTKWERTYGSTGFDTGYSVQQTMDGGYVIAGIINSTDLYLIKTDSNGNEIWSNTFQGNDYYSPGSLQQTMDGGYIMVGDISLGVSASYGIYLIKTNANGDEQWRKTFVGDMYGSSAQQTADGGYIIAGTIFNAGQYDFYLIKTDSNGNEFWTKTLGRGDYDIARSVRQTIDGGYIIVGYTNTLAAGTQVYVIKTDADGSEIWSNSFGGSDSDIAHSVQQTMDGGYVIVGDTLSFGAGGYDVYLIMTDADGNEIRSKTFGGSEWDFGRSVQQTMDGGYVVVGSTQSFGAGGYDVYLIMTDADGNEVRSKTFGGSDSDIAHSVQQTMDGGYIIGADTQSFGAGSRDGYIIKTDAYGNCFASGIKP